MITILGTILAFVIVFGILVFIHELGHFAMAKAVGIRVETFSFGYGKRLIGFKKGHTDYRISVLPLGGYVKFLGEGMFEPGRELAPDDFMAKSRWKRFLVIVMGAVMNIILAIVIVAAINMVGQSVPEYLDKPPVIGWIDADSPAAKAGLQVEDEILSINRKKVATWSDVEIAVGTRPEEPPAHRDPPGRAGPPDGDHDRDREGHPLRDRLCRILRQDPDPGPHGHPRLTRGEGRASRRATSSRRSTVSPPFSSSSSRSSKRAPGRSWT